MTKRQLTTGVMVAATIVLIEGTAIATQGSGTTASVVARAAFVDRVDLKLSVKSSQGGRDNIAIRDTGETVMQEIVFVPGGESGWHSHYGPAVILIRAGQLTFYSEDDPGCSGRTFTAGQAFIEPPGLVHFARNESASDDAEVGVTYLDVPSGEGPRIDEPSPGNCPF
jgi:quercetin dioxygenase-like cupin family protein